MDSEPLRALIAEHRMNVVAEDLPYSHQARTRVKCDGETCNFRFEGGRYWDVVRKHDDHLVEVLIEAGVLPLRMDHAERYDLATHAYGQGLLGWARMLPLMHRRMTEAARDVIDKVYGTDPRHWRMGKAIADHVMFGRPIPWKL